MKKFVAIAIVVMLAMIAFNITIDLGHSHVAWDDGDFDGPFAALIGIAAGGMGLVIGGVVLAVVGVMLALLFAGLGILAVAGLVIGAVVLAALMSPLLVPILIPVAFIWYFSRRSRRAKMTQEAAV